jgi:hypothetical protein
MLGPLISPAMEVAGRFLCGGRVAQVARNLGLPEASRLMSSGDRVQAPARCLLQALFASKHGHPRAQ